MLKTLFGQGRPVQRLLLTQKQCWTICSNATEFDAATP